MTVPARLPALLLLSLSLAAPGVSAQTSASPPAAPANVLSLPETPEALSDTTRPFALDFNWTRDGLVTGAAGAMWLATEALFKHELSPQACRWCDGDDLNAVDAWGRGLRAGSRGELLMDGLSNVVDFGILPLAVLGTQAMLAYREGTSQFISEDVTMVVEATVLTLAINQGVKFAVGRERPFVRELDPAERGTVRDPADNNLSFFSGHSSFAFSLAVAAGTVAELRGYDRRWLVWAVGLPLAASVPILRMAADRHYLSDVLIGSAFGAAMGAAVPLLLHPRIGQLPVQLSASPNSVGVSGQF